MLYFIFFYPGVTALIIAGYGYAHDSFGYKEVSVNSPVGVPIWQLKALIPLAGDHAVHPGHRPGDPLHPVHPHRPLAAASSTTSRSSRPCSSTSTKTGAPRERRPMSNPQLALLMLGSFIFIILLGFPIAFTLMAMGVMFGFYAYYVPGQEFFDSRVFYLLSQNTFSIMNNDVLTAVPLFLFMGYMIERSNILDRLFYSLQVALRAIPGVDGGGGARHLRAVRHRDRHRRRGGDADGPARLPGDAQGRLRPEAVGRRDLRRRHARHPDSAVDHADRLRRHLGGLGGEALRRGDHARASCWPACTSAT